MKSTHVSEQSYRPLFQYNPQPMWVYELRSLRFLAVNSAALDQYGYSRDEFLGMTIKDIRPAEDLPRLLTNVAAQVPGLEHAGRWRHRRRDGSLFDVEITSHELKWDGHPAKLVVARDVTAEVEARAEIQRINLELERRVAERTAQLAAINEELEAFTYSVSHDLRAPLRQVDGFSRILLEELGERAGVRERHTLQRIREGTAKMAQLIDDLLGFSRLTRQPIRWLRTDLGALVDDVLADLAGEPEGRRIEIRREPLPMVYGDPALLKQVFANLLSNALKFSRPRDPAIVEIGQLRVRAQAAIYVRDNGVGFDPKYADQIFGVFQRLHRPEEFEGTGVGLATVQRIVGRHGGRVWAEAEPGRGATFYFTLGPPPDGPSAAAAGGKS